MTKGKSKTGGRSGSDSNSGSRASASDQRSDRRSAQGGNIKLGADNRGKLKDWQGGTKRESRR